MSVRAKFRVESVAEVAWDKDARHIKLSAVTAEVSKTWSKYTPSGVLEMSITNPEAHSQFKVGEYLYLDFSPAPAAGD